MLHPSEYYVAVDKKVVHSGKHFHAPGRCRVTPGGGYMSVLHMVYCFASKQSSSYYTGVHLSFENPQNMHVRTIQNKQTYTPRGTYTVHGIKSYLVLIIPAMHNSFVKYS